MSWEYDLPETLIDSLRRGIALYFVAKCGCKANARSGLTRIWGISNSFSASVSVRLPVSIGFSRGGLSQTYDTLEQILPITRHLIGWRIAESSLLKDSSLEIEARMRLDSSRLPKPLQVIVGGNSDWELDSDWITIDVQQALKATLFPDPSRL